MTATGSDRAKAARVAEAVLADAAWLVHLSWCMPMRCIPDFVDPELETAHQGFMDVLACLVDEIGEIGEIGETCCLHGEVGGRHGCDGSKMGSRFTGVAWVR